MKGLRGRFDRALSFTALSAFLPLQLRSTFWGRVPPLPSSLPPPCATSVQVSVVLGGLLDTIRIFPSFCSECDEQLPFIQPLVAGYSKCRLHRRCFLLQRFHSTRHRIGY
jgi:hypothetical protein